MRVPADLNLVRVTGLGISYTPPKGFSRGWVQLEGDHQKYLVRVGYRLARCPSGHSFREGCATCAPYHGAVAVFTPDCPYCCDNPSPLCPYCEHVRATFAKLYPELPVGHRAKRSGALASPGPLGRNGACPECRGLGEVSIYPCARCGGSGELTADGSPRKVAAR